MAAHELRMPGSHNQANALAALAIGTALGFEQHAMLETLRRFPGLPHRTEFIAEIDGVIFYNDSKGTNVGATIAALRGLARHDDSRSVLIAGGDCKGADFSDLASVLAESVRAVVLLGRDARSIAAVVPDSIPCKQVASMGEAVAEAARFAQRGDRVLLSPGCASFDMFKGFADRGDRFRQAVRELSS
jgi:UDP-N-acetylmuramoylalanine--D-glutamate ligase